jgi:hypothetical protein
MKRPFPGFIALSAAGMLALIPAALGQTVYEPFSYINGVLNGRNGGTGFSGGWNDVAGDLIKSSSPLSVSGLSGTGSYVDVTTADASRNLTSSLSGDTWISFVIQPDPGTLGFGGLVIGGGGASVNGHSGISSGIFVGFSGATYGINAVGGAGFQISGGTAVAGTAQYLVADFDFTGAGSGTVTFYVNATPTGTLGSAAGSEAFTLPTSNAISFDANSDGASFDEIRIGNSFAAVTPIPEPADVATGLALFALGAAGMREHRRRRKLAA